MQTLLHCLHYSYQVSGLREVTPGTARGNRKYPTLQAPLCLFSSHVFTLPRTLKRIKLCPAPADFGLQSMKWGRCSWLCCSARGGSEPTPLACRGFPAGPKKMPSTQMPRPTTHISLSGYKKQDIFLRTHCVSLLRNNERRLLFTSNTGDQESSKSNLSGCLVKRSVKSQY